jgi:hypothetical protein
MSVHVAIYAFLGLDAIVVVAVILWVNSST